MVSPFYSFGLGSSFIRFVLSSSMNDSASQFTASLAVSASVHRSSSFCVILVFSGIIIGSTV